MPVARIKPSLSWRAPLRARVTPEHDEVARVVDRVFEMRRDPFDDFADHAGDELVGLFDVCEDRVDHLLGPAEGDAAPVGELRFQRVEHLDDLFGRVLTVRIDFVEKFAKADDVALADRVEQPDQLFERKFFSAVLDRLVNRFDDALDDGPDFGNAADDRHDERKPGAEFLVLAAKGEPVQIGDDVAHVADLIDDRDQRHGRAEGDLPEALVVGEVARERGAEPFRDRDDRAVLFLHLGALRRQIVRARAVTGKNIERVRVGGEQKFDPFDIVRQPVDARETHLIETAARERLVGRGVEDLITGAAHGARAVVFVDELDPVRFRAVLHRRDRALLLAATRLIDLFFQ
jgi:hypothetical protein